MPQLGSRAERFGTVTWKGPAADATVMSDRMFEGSPANISGKQAIENRGTRQLFLIHVVLIFCGTVNINLAHCYSPLMSRTLEYFVFTFKY